MASLQDTVTKSLRHMGDMTFSQRMAIGLGALLVIGSMAWLAQWAATSEMTPLLPGQSLEPEDLALVRAGLEAMNEPYKIEGSQVLVRAGANRDSLLASLQQAEKLPSDTSIGFAALLKESNPWISQAENDRRWSVALQSELADVLKQFNGVKRARVMLNMRSKRAGWSRNQPESSASVTLFMSGDAPVTRSLANAVARMVAGAIRELKVQNVEVIDGGNGRVALNWEEEEPGTANNLHQLQKQIERDTRHKIMEQLSFDGAALVSVSVDLDYSTKQVQDSKVTEGAAVKEKNDDTSTTRNRLSGQPGVQPNVGVAAGGGGSADSSTATLSETISEPSRTNVITQTPAGVPTNIRAAVSLSYSYLAGIVRLKNPETEDPAEEQIEAEFAKQKDRIAEHVAKLVNPPVVDQVSVDWHYDTLDQMPVVAASSMDLSLDLAQKYGPVSGLSLLALISLAMMMKLAKRKDSGESFGMEIGLPKEAVEAARRAADDLESYKPPQHAPGGAYQGGGQGGYAGDPSGGMVVPFGDAAEGVLEAREVDEETVRIGHMISQVAEMAEEDGDSVATLLETWIDESR